MPTLIKTNAWILHKFPYMESSLILKVFTLDAGPVSLIAKGAHRKGNSLRGLLDYFNECELVFRGDFRSDLQLLTDGALVRELPNLKRHPGAQSLGHLLLEIMLRHATGSDGAIALYGLLSGALDTLAHERLDADGASALLCDFLMGFAMIQGYAPQFRDCSHCGVRLGKLTGDFDLEMGGPVCASCIDTNSQSVGKLRPRIGRWLDRVQERGVSREPLGSRDRHHGEDFLLDYLALHAGHRPTLKALEVYRQLW